MAHEDFAFSAYTELVKNILPFWRTHARDLATGGFYGAISSDNSRDPNEPRSIVMTARHLWTYSAAARLLNEPELLEMADYAFDSVVSHFIDPVHNGVFWSVNPDGSPAVTKKQVYGQAFALYGLCEYGLAVCAVRNDFKKATEIVSYALPIFLLLESHARDEIHGGYIEALAQDWSETADLKLSEKDIDCAKSMNTNLHVMEAYSCFHKYLSLIVPEDPEFISHVEEALYSLVMVTANHILGEDGHLDLYFTSEWKQIGDPISFGHDIESSWLMWEAAEQLESKFLKESIKSAVIRIADIALQEGWDPKTGGFENEIHNGKRDTNRIWWCQAEAVVGFINAWEITGDQKYLDATHAIWQWIQEKQVDRKYGDWFLSVSAQGLPDLSEIKGGNWKTGYHNARCCMEILKRLRRAK
ncbi:MAG TPA: AGE family epimerase/isomerase [Treponemataceae bacterium]|nr:AGE family epimerase/isomerase [Treponemataceae bacterium]